jgi:dihydroorotate dehydrogenase electron transfer subunit
MKKHISDLTVLSNTQINHNHCLIELKSDIPLAEIEPGQFVEVKVNGSESTYLRRPFSVHRVDAVKNTMHLLIKVVGNGTEMLSSLLPGDMLNVMFPLGKGFTIPDSKNVLLVGGGCGVAPLHYLATKLNEKNNVVNILIGGRTANDIILAEEYRSLGNLYISTEDGSIGEKGMVTSHPIISDKKDTTTDYSNLAEQITTKFDKIYCCGPDGMMRAVAHIAEQMCVPCEVSLENTMACGIGACLCCVVESNKGNICVCTEGPVFDSKILKGWTQENEVGCSLDQ